MLKKILATLSLCALCTSAPITANAAVYVTDGTGDVQEYYDVPALPVSGNVHCEYIMGMVTAPNGDGTVLYSTDNMGGYIAYRPYPVHVGDAVQTFLLYRADESGEWEDDIVWRIDITE